MIQSDLFPALKAAAPTWTRITAPGNCGNIYLHSSGWTVQHCGHPTALRPYIIVGPGGEVHLSDAGQGFTTLQLAKKRAEELIK